MKNKKIRIAILFGGKSAEHEVSIQSAKNVYASLDKKKYDVVLIGIDKLGKWHKSKDVKLLTNYDEVPLVTAGGKGSLTTSFSSETIDVIFPVLHGTYGEDGSMQGLLKIANIPFVGSGVLGLAVGMDKDVAKRLLRDAGLPVANFLVFRKGDSIKFIDIKKKLGLPFFVKPANLGSSVGVAKVKSEKDFSSAIRDAFLYDTKILVEQYVAGREIECAVLGNENPIVSLPGEIVVHHEFYDYTAKYLDEKAAELKIPAQISAKKVKKMQDLAIKAFKTLCLEGMARIDFFLTPKGKFYINEANTIPGFTNISMYPKLWEVSGIGYSELLDRLIKLAIERDNAQLRLKTSL